MTLVEVVRNGRTRRFTLEESRQRTEAKKAGAGREAAEALFKPKVAPQLTHRIVYDTAPPQGNRNPRGKRHK